MDRYFAETFIECNISDWMYHTNTSMLTLANFRWTGFFFVYFVAYFFSILLFVQFVQTIKPLNACVCRKCVCVCVNWLGRTKSVAKKWRLVACLIAFRGMNINEAKKKIQKEIKNAQNDKTSHKMFTHESNSLHTFIFFSSHRKY